MWTNVDSVNFGLLIVRTNGDKYLKIRAIGVTEYLKLVVMQIATWGGGETVDEGKIDCDNSIGSYIKQNLSHMNVFFLQNSFVLFMDHVSLM